MSWLKPVVILSIVILFSTCQTATYKIAPHSPSQEGVTAGKYIPYFEAPDSTNHLVSIEQVMGKATIIDFWASWCRPCRESANPAYLKLFRKYHQKGLNIIGISLDRHHYFWQKALQQDSLPWVQTIDSTRELTKLFKVKRTPTMFLIDRHGKIIGKNLWGKDLVHKIDSLLNN